MNFSNYTTMNEFNTELARQLHLDECLSSWFKDGKGKEMLYVGGHLRFGRNLQMFSYFWTRHWKIDVIEIWPENVEQLKGIDKIHELITGDIMEFNPMRQYDCVMWWHGPEHLEMTDVADLIKQLKKYTKSIIFATPNGKYDQGEEYGNPHERHLSTWYKEDFEALGMNAFELGNRDEKNGNLVAWWRAKE
jgi:hypothetical protein